MGTSLLGLDFGFSSVKMVHLVEDGESLVLERIDSRDWASVGGGGSDEEKRLAVLRELLKGVNARGARSTVSLNGPKVSLRVFSTPSMPKGELKEAVRIEAKHYFPFPIDTAELDCEIVGDDPEKDSGKQRVAVATAPRETVQEVLERTS